VYAAPVGPFVIRRALVPCAIFIPLGLAYTLGMAILSSTAIQGHYRRLQHGAVQDPACGAWFDVDVVEVSEWVTDTNWTPLRVSRVDAGTVTGFRLNDVEQEVLELPIIARPLEPLPRAATTMRTRTSFGLPFRCISRVLERDVTKARPMVPRDSRPAHLLGVRFELPTRIHPLALGADTVVAAAVSAAMWYMSVYAFRGWRGKIRERRKQCLGCGYPRDEELGPEAKCPECGAIPRPKSAAKTSASPEAAG
jgi:hypothetical protein